MMDPDRSRGYGIEQFDLTSSCEILDVKSPPGEQAWRPFPELNLARFGLQLLPIELESRAFLLAIGGRGPHPLAEYSVEAIELDVQSGLNKDAEWTVLNAKLMTSRIDFAATPLQTANDAKKVNIVILGGNRVTEEDSTDSSRTWEILEVFVDPASKKLSAKTSPGPTRLPSSRVGCRAGVLGDLVPGKSILAVAGGFKAWGEGQTTYGGPIDKSVALLEIGQDSSDREGVGQWIEPLQTSGLEEMQKLPVPLRQPATCVLASMAGASSSAVEDL
eukprot:TRINITY_DN20884_c0_g1_i1.p1 TRINITY_DN20884_c0_g1~~TRINITY_DN20884_c0_g1_i1.p1  ORF type:complete len:275 (-),score=62.75 TRINITY_DN20884_c0_g1_i1:285-1109(-)